MTCATRLLPGETTLEAWDRLTDARGYRVRISPAEAPGHVTLSVVCPVCGGPWETIVKLGDSIDLSSKCSRCRE